MNSADLKTNGNGNGTPAVGEVRKRHAKPAPVSETQKLASFELVEPQAIDSQIWPLHALVWLQPELTPVPPRSSGRRIERQHRVPVSDYLYPRVEPVCSRPAPEQSCEPMPPDFGRGIPKGDLSPLGWDPRAVCMSHSKGLK